MQWTDDRAGRRIDAAMTLRALFPFPCNNDFASHPPFSLVRHLSETDLRAELWVTRRGPRARTGFVRTAVPGNVFPLIERVNRTLRPGSSWTRTLTERRYAGAFQDRDTAWVYRGCSLGLMRSLCARGHVVLLERVNTMDHTALRIITDAFTRAGWPIEPPYTLKSPDQDQACVDAADFVFSPSPLVTASLLERGIAKHRILESSYGWDPQRFATTGRALPPADGVTFLFVGSVGLRKGAHLLLNAWSRAGIKGRLVLAGRMESLIARKCADHLNRADVIHLDYNPDPAPVYRSADIFAFPTLEEGSPLVSYEAIGTGLPVVTSPMGAGEIIRHGVEGLVVDPHDAEQVIAALRELAGDAERRRAMGQAARSRAADYTWDRVARRRYALIKKALATR